MDDVTARRLGERIVLLREGRGMSMTELADVADLAKSYLFKIERGEVLNPGIQTLTSIAEALGTTVHDLLPRPDRAGKENSGLAFEMVVDTIPRPLWEFLRRQEEKNDPVPDDAKRALALMRHRGRRPETADDYALLYSMLKRFTT